MSLVGVFWLDLFDRTYYPTSGVSLFARSEISESDFGSDATFSRHYLDFRSALPIHRRLSVQTQLILGTTDGDNLPAHYNFILGGLNTAVLFLEREMTRIAAVGLKSQELVGRHIQFLQAGLQYELSTNLFMLLRANAGNTFEDWEFDFSSDRFESGVGLTLGLATPIGPVELSAMHGSRHNFVSHLNIGMKF